MSNTDSPLSARAALRHAHSASRLAPQHAPQRTSCRAPRLAPLRTSRTHHSRGKLAPLGVVGATLALLASTLAPASPAHALDLQPRGVDVSSHQHPFGENINWLKVRLGGYSFAMIKATEGTDYINPFFAQNRDAAHRVGMIVGSYHYARPNQSPIEQALHYAETIECQKKPLEMPPVLDLEETGGLSPLFLQGWTAVFITTLNLRCATNTMMYTYPYFWRTHMRDTSLFSFAPLWLADYNGGTEPTQPLPGGWKNWNIWQYSSWGRVPGINTAVDLNKFNGGYVSLAAFSLRQVVVPTIPTIFTNGKWSVEPTYLRKALQQQQLGQTVTPLYQVPYGVNSAQLQRTTVNRAG